MSSLWLAHSCGPFWRGKFLGIGDVLACDIRRPNQWSGSRHLRGGRWDEILDAEYTKSSSIKSRRHSAPSPRWRFQQLSSPKWPARMRSSSPKRTHIFGRAELPLPAGASHTFRRGSNASARRAALDAAFKIDSGFAFICLRLPDSGRAK